MKLEVDWMRPLKLRDASKQNLIYSVDLKKVPHSSGIYIFGRRWGRQVEALYIGQAQDLYYRIRGQFNNLRVMQHLKNAKAGSRVLLVGRLAARPGQQLEKSLDLIERATIRYFLSEGHDLVNKQGTRLWQHTVTSFGKYRSAMIPRLMHLEKRRGG